jgi:hypothetical protein
LYLLLLQCQHSLLFGEASAVALATSVAMMAMMAMSLARKSMAHHCSVPSVTGE